MITLSEQPIDPVQMQEDFINANDGAGGIVSFIGLVRPTSTHGTVEKLHLQAYSPLTENSIAKELEKAHQVWSLSSALVAHRIGEVFASEPIVFLATASVHRRAAFEAADFLMDYLKTKAIFWKKEITNSGEYWIEPREEDYGDAKRWAQVEETAA